MPVQCDETSTQRPGIKFLGFGEVALLVFCVCLFSAAARADDLLAHASEDTLWIATPQTVREFRGSVQRTVIRYRSLDGEPTWHELPSLTGRAVDLASRGSTLAVLMENHEWLMAWPNGFSTGASLPGGAQPLALASERETIWAVALSGPAPATMPVSSGAAASAKTSSTRSTNRDAGPPAPATPTTTSAEIPSMHAAEDRLALFVYTGAAWSRVADLPADVPVQPAELSLGVVAGQPVVAVPAGGGSVRIWQLGADKNWLDRGSVQFGFPVRQLQLIGGSQRAILWAAADSGAGSLVMGDDAAWSPPRPLELSRSLPMGAPRAIVAAAGNIRLFFLAGKDPATPPQPGLGQLHEQCYKFDGTRSGEAAVLTAPRPTLVNPYGEWWTMAAMVTLIGLMFVTVRRRVTESPAGLAAEHAVTIAPAGLRLAAGVLDLLPVIVTFFVLVAKGQHTIGTYEMPPGPLIAAGVLYLLHTSICELLLGRSVGKMIAGLRIVSVDGGPPGAVPILLRNAMRLVDFFPFCPVLGGLILISPLRQRMGDILARTLVVVPNAKRPDDDSAADNESQHSRDQAKDRRED